MTRRNEAAYRAAEQELFAHYGVAPRERLVDVEAIATRVRVLETGAGDPVVFVHGSPNTAATWIPLAARLLDRRCILIERPGAGLSDAPRAWGDHRRAAVAIVTSVLDALGVRDADFVGSSFGSLYGYDVARDAPERLRRLVVMGAPCAPGCLPMPAIFRMLSLPGLPVLMKNAMKPDLREARDMWREIGHGAAIDRGALPDVLFTWYAALLNCADTLQGTCDEVRAIATPLGWRARSRVGDDGLRAIAAPTLMLWGDDDSFAKPDAGARLAALSRATFQRLPASGHLPWVDDPAGIADRVRAFLPARAGFTPDAVPARMGA
jgi:pimeloyl-ACP methyl ester carboxylesterase